MNRSMITGLIFTTLPSAGLATIGPPIAYGTTASIFLVNPDGTGLRTLYSAPRKSSIGALTIRPGGGELAFVENKKLKVIDYDDRGVATGAARSISLPCGTILSADFAPDGSLAVKDGCAPNNIWRVAPGASASDAAPLVTSSGTVGDPIWSRDGTRFYYEMDDGIHAYDVAASSSSLILSPDRSTWDVTQTGDRLILGSTNYNYFVHDISTGADTDGCTQAFQVHYGNNDAQMIYRSAGSSHGGGSYILLTNSDCSGAPFRITGKSGSYIGPDWAAP